MVLLSTRQGPGFLWLPIRPASLDGKSRIVAGRPEGVDTDEGQRATLRPRVQETRVFSTRSQRFRPHALAALPRLDAAR